MYCTITSTEATLAATPNVSVKACAQKAFDYLSFNCYTGPSGGNPVLRDAKFRQARNWAIDRQKLVSLAYDGNATPGSSRRIAWHWRRRTGN